MWKTVEIKEPLIIDAKDWHQNEFATICKLFDLEPDKVNQIVLRETCSYEYLSEQREKGA